MGQYMLNKKDDFQNLNLALNQYKIHSINISPFSLGNRTEHLHKKLQNKQFNFTKEKGLTFYIENKKWFNFPLKKNRGGFKIEYQDEKHRRLWIPDYNPNDPTLPKPTYSSLGKVVDDLLLEIYFKGKIKIEPHNIFKKYWKISKI